VDVCLNWAASLNENVQTEAPKTDGPQPLRSEKLAGGVVKDVILEGSGDLPKVAVLN
jgi:hypothetical protein